MLKTAMENSSKQVSVSLEAQRQAAFQDKVASAPVQQPAGPIDLDLCLKLASAIEVIAEDFEKEATPGEGPNALHVMQAEASTPIKENKGHGHNTVPMHTGLQAAVSGAATQVPNDAHRAPGGPGHQTTAMTAGQGKTASIASAAKAAFAKVAEDAALEKKETEGMEAAKKGLEKAEHAHKKEEGEKEGSAPTNLVDYLIQKTKTAEDAINPAKISAGAAVPPEASASGQSGGAPVGGPPQGPTSLIQSNESAEHFKKNQAYAPRKAELGKYFNEPALSSSTDSTLQAAFAHTGEAGTKLSSVSAKESTAAAIKVAAAQATLKKLAEQAESNKSVKDQGEKGAQT